MLPSTMQICGDASTVSEFHEGISLCCGIVARESAGFCASTCAIRD
jgi:hypothetical protein